MGVLTSDGIQHNRELLVSLRGSVEDVVAALASSHGRSHMSRRVISNLVREYLQALCRLDAMDVAGHFVSAVRCRTAAPQCGSKSSRETLTNDDWLSPLLLRLKERGEWEKIEEVLFDSSGSADMEGLKVGRRSETVSSQRASMYDHTCEALRRAGQWEKLAEVMSSYSRR